jgi:hypothetical protein
MNSQVSLQQFAMAKRLSHPKINSSGNSLGATTWHCRSLVAAIRLRQ